MTFEAGLSRLFCYSQANTPTLALQVGPGFSTGSAATPHQPGTRFVNSTGTCRPAFPKVQVDDCSSPPGISLTKVTSGSPRCRPSTVPPSDLLCAPPAALLPS